jgi:tetratricopeptide (TPR) repeat protein
LKISEEIEDNSGIADAYINIGNVYTKQKKNKEASFYLNKALSLSKDIGSLDYIKNGYEGLAKLDSAQGNFKQALEYYKLYTAYRDSIFNEENTKKMVQISNAIRV